MTPLTIEDLKKHLGPGLGLRKSKYMLEIPVPGTEGETINILCRSTAFPERNVGTVAVFNKGRKYNMRSETAYPGTYSISVLDDSNMALRWLFDGWLTLVDDSEPKDSPSSTSSYEVKPSFSLGGMIGGTQTNYQADVNVWQLGNMGEKIYGYKLQNAFPTSLGIVELDDSDESTLSEFSVVFTYSESIPLKPESGSMESFSEANILGAPAKGVQGGGVTSGMLANSMVGSYSSGIPNNISNTMKAVSGVGGGTIGLNGLASKVGNLPNGLSSPTNGFDSFNSVSTNLSSIGNLINGVNNITSGVSTLVPGLSNNVSSPVSEIMSGLNAVKGVSSGVNSLVNLGGVKHGVDVTVKLGNEITTKPKTNVNVGPIVYKI